MLHFHKMWSKFARWFPRKCLLWKKTDVRATTAVLLSQPNRIQKAHLDWYMYLHDIVMIIINLVWQIDYFNKEYHVFSNGHSLKEDPMQLDFVFVTYPDVALAGRMAGTFIICQINSEGRVTRTTGTWDRKNGFISFLKHSEK